MREVAVLGVGMTRFGRFPQSRLRDLGREACWEAIKDAGISPQQVEAGYCGNALGGYLQREFGIGQSVLWEVGIRGIPIINIENACASGSSAFREAWIAIAAGLYDIALAVGVEKTYTEQGGVLDIGDAEPEVKIGATLPSIFGIIANRYMAEFGATPEQLAKVSVKNHKHGVLNPYAQYRKEVTIEEVLASPMIADPLTLLSCTPKADGAAAAVLTTVDIARRITVNPITVAASVLRTGLYENPADVTRFEMSVKAAQEAYEKAGAGPHDLNVIELHDCFTISEIGHYESLGLCGKGEGVRMVDEGVTELGGRLPVNVSGGLLARGHPLGATGIAQIIEIVWQLRGNAGERQVEGAKIGLTHCMGGVKAGDAQAATIHILKR